MASSASYADCRERATSDIGHGARSNEHVTPSILRGGGDITRKQPKYSANLTGQAGKTTGEIGNMLSRPGGRHEGVKSHRPGRAWARDLKISPSGPGTGWARRGRPRPTRPHNRKWAPPAKTVGFDMLDCLPFEYSYVTERDIKLGITAIIVRNETC